MKLFLTVLSIFWHVKMKLFLTVLYTVCYFKMKIYICFSTGRLPNKTFRKLFNIVNIYGMQIATNNSRYLALLKTGSP
jgi:hypothetical protein